TQSPVSVLHFGRPATAAHCTSLVQATMQVLVFGLQSTVPLGSQSVAVRQPTQVLVVVSHFFSGPLAQSLSLLHCTQLPSAQTPELQVPHWPPQPSSPQALPAHCGVQLTH